MKISMEGVEADAFPAAVVDSLCNRLKMKWDWDPKGEIGKKPGKNNACHLQVGITSLVLVAEKLKYFLSLREEQENPKFRVYLWIQGPADLVGYVAPMFDT